MSESSRSRRGSGLAAVAVVFVAVLMWWLFSGNGPQGPRGNDERYAVPDVDVSPPVATDGSTPGPTEPTLTDPNGVRVESYVLEGDTRLVLNYATGPAACSGALSTPRVLESDASVIVTLSLDPPDSPADVCAAVMVPRSVAVTIGSPLAGRAVLDGGFNPPVRVERTQQRNE